MSLTASENPQASTPVAPKLDAIHEAQETSSSVDPKPEDLAPHARVPAPSISNTANLGYASDHNSSGQKFSVQNIEFCLK